MSAAHLMDTTLDDRGGASGMVSRILTRYGGRLLILILVVAAWIRFTGLDRIVHSNHDEVNPLLAGFRLTQSSFLPTESWVENFFVQLFLYYNGASSPLIQFVNLEILNLFGIPLQEFFLFLPYAIWGLLSILGLYFLGNRWFDKPTGLLAAFLAAVAPFHGVISRINHPMVGNFVNQVFMFLVADRLLTTKRKVWAALFSLMLAFEVLSNNGFPFTLLILAYFGWVRLRREGDTPALLIRRTIAFKKETALIWWGIIPLIVILLQLGLFAVYVQRGVWLGLLAWSFRHTRPMTVSTEALKVFGSSFGYLLILAALAAFIQYFRQLFRLNHLGLQIWWIILLGLPFLGIFSAQEVHLIATCGIPVFLLTAHGLVRGIQSRKAWLRVCVVVVAALVIAEALSGSMVVNLARETPSGKWYNPAESQGAVGGSHRYRAMKSAGYWIRKFGKPRARIYINKNPNLGELYMGTVRCACGDPKRKRLFGGANIEPEPPVDYFVILENGPVSDDLRTLLQSYHLVGNIRESGAPLARIYSKEPQSAQNLEHIDAVRRFNEEFARLDRYITSPYVGMTFWLE